MSIGTRIARHGSAKLRTAITSAPPDPLLFLYPTWARNSSTTAIPSYLEQLLSDILPLKEVSIPQKDNCSSFSSSRLSAIAQSAAVPKESTPGSGPSSIVVADDRRSNEISTNKRVQRLERVYVKKRQTYQRKVENRRTWQAQRNEALKRDWDPDWRVVLHDLTQRTPHHGKWLKDPIMLEVSAPSLSKLMDGLDEDIWTVAQKHDCVVRVCRRKAGENTVTNFTLSGSPVAISRTTAHLLRIVPGIHVKATPTVTTTEDLEYRISDVDVGNCPKFVASDNTTKRSAYVQVPQNRTQESFYQEVHAITHSTSSNHANRLANLKDDQRILAITARLHELFTSPSMKRFVSTKAVKEALSFYMKHNNVAAARLLFNSHSHNDLEMFNIMLRLPAENNDIHNFHYILNLMDRKGHRPNFTTWLAFLEANKESLEIQLVILAAMRSKGLIQHVSSVRAVANVLAPPMIQLELSNGAPVEEIMRKLDERFGADWLGLSTANRFLHELGTCGLISQCCDFLQIMASRDILPDVNSINTVLHHCEKAHMMEGAIEFLRLLSETTMSSLNGETYQILFEMAWQSRSYNIARVLWKYACLSLNVTPRMRTLVHRSLRRRVKGTSSNSARSLSVATIGQFILASPSQHSTSTIRGATQDGTTTMSAGAMSQDWPGTRLSTPTTKLTKIIHHEMVRDLDCKPAQSLVASLTDAIAVDTTWKREERGTKVKKTLASMLESRVQIRLHSRTESEHLHRK